MTKIVFRNGGAEVKVLCSPLKFFHTILCLYEPYLEHTLCHAGTYVSPLFPVKGNLKDTTWKDILENHIWVPNCLQFTRVMMVPLMDSQFQNPLLHFSGIQASRLSWLLKLFGCMVGVIVLLKWIFSTDLISWPLGLNFSLICFSYITPIIFPSMTCNGPVLFAVK